MEKSSGFMGRCATEAVVLDVTRTEPAQSA